MHRSPFALLLLVGACAILIPASASARQIHQHITLHVPDHRPIVVTRVVDVAPADSDDDGCRNSKDTYNGPGCNPPAPAPAAQSVSSVAAPAPATSSVATGSASAIPGYITACESGGNYNAVNPSSGAYGAYQIMPSTASAYGCDLSTPAGQDACAAEIYADVGSSAWSCG